jgi:hypothetical protein
MDMLKLIGSQHSNLVRSALICEIYKIRITDIFLLVYITIILKASSLSRKHVHSVRKRRLYAGRSKRVKELK